VSVGGSVHGAATPPTPALLSSLSLAKRAAGEGKLEPKLQQTRSHPRASGDLCLMAQRRFPLARE